MSRLKKGAAVATEHQSAGAGTCHWCRQEVLERVFQWDGWGRVCPDGAACELRRYKWLTEVGSRPKSFYRSLAAGEAEAVRECKRANVNIELALQAIAEEEPPPVGLPPQEVENS